MSTQAEANISTLSNSSFSTKSLVWNAVLAAAVLIAIVALIAAQRRPEAIHYPAGNAFP